MLSRRLFLFRAAAFIPMVALLAFGLYAERQERLAKARESVVRIARIVSDRHRVLLARSESMAELLASLPAVRGEEWSRVDEILVGVIQRFPEYTNVRISALDGSTVSSALPNEPAWNNRGRAWFDEVVRTGGHAVGGYFMGLSTQKPSVVLGYPVRNYDGRITHVLSITIDLTDLALFHGPELPRRSSVMVIGRNGTVLASGPESGGMRGQAVSATLFSELRSRRSEGVLETDRLDGTPSMVGYVALPVANGSDGLYLAVAVPRAELLAGVSRTLLWSSIGVAVVVVFVFGMGAQASLVLVLRPLNTLLDVTGRLTAGDLSARAPTRLTDDKGEFGRFARSLNALAAQLQRRESSHEAEMANRARAAIALRESESRLREAQRVARLGNWELDVKSGALHWSEEIYRIFEIDPVNFKASYEAFLAIVHPDDRELVDTAYTASLRTRQSYRIVHRLLMSDGRIKHVEEQCETVYGEDGLPVRSLGTVQDVTEHVRVEEALRASEATLEQRVIDRTRELEASNRELEAFSYAVSHDLRAPLRAIDGFSQALIGEEAGHLSEGGRQDLLRIRRAAQRMGDIIDALLQLSRLLLEPMEIEHVDLSALARQVMEDLLESGGNPSVEVVIAPDLSARGDRRLLRAALTNLLGNAVKFSSLTPNPRVEVGECDVDGVRAFFVRDNGAGFDMTYAGKLFVPFERLHKAGDFPGTGIGLTTVQRIVQRHGGRVWAESRPGEGATFYFVLDRPNVSAAA